MTEPVGRSVPTPQRGDVVWASLDPTVGHEQAGHRPHLVLSDPRLHEARELVIVVPLTSKPHAIPTHVQVGPDNFAICEQPRTMSLRRVTKVEARGYDIGQVVAVLKRLIGG